MKFRYARNKVSVAALLGVIFALSIFVRLSMLNKPLCRPREWLSANVLRTLQTWHETGIVRAHFAPIMTYPGQANKNINNVNNYGLDQPDEQGNFYYTSYPPLAFYVPYFIFETLHIYPAVFPLQVVSLTLHLITGLFIYLSLRVLVGSEDKVCVAGIIAFAVYIFSPQTLWLQANVYMSDIFVQVFFVAGIHLVLKWAKHGPSGTSSYFTLGAVTFCFVYTEWLGVFFAIFLVVFGWLNGDRAWAKGFRAAIIGGATAAVVLMVFQYSKINGLDAFLAYSRQRYLLRSGMGAQPQMNFHPWNLLGWLLLITYLLLAYAADFLLVALWVALKRRGRSLFLAKNMKRAVLFAAVFPPLLHHLVFFNFSADHEFSTLKDAPIIAIVAGLLAWCLWVGAREGPPRRMRLLVLASLAGFFVAAAYEYKVVVGPYVSGYKEIGDYIFKEARPDEIVFLKSADPNGVTNEPFPQMLLYAHRNIARWQDVAHARDLARRNGVPRAVIFFLDRDETKVVEHTRLTL